MDADGPLRDFDSDLAELQLLHLADSALPIGGLAHSFGLESLVSHELLEVNNLAEFLRGFLEEAGTMEAVFCREAFRLAEMKRVSERRPEASVTGERATEGAYWVDRWVELNERLSAMKPARESRAGSGSLGRNVLAAVAGLGDFANVREALRASRAAGGLIHHSAAFGLASGTLGFEEDRAVLAYLHQAIASLVSACQRLLPLGQSAAMRILWDLKLAMIETARRSATCALDDAWCFMPLLDWGAMEHPALTTRLFIS